MITDKPKICAVIISDDTEAVKRAEVLVDMLELRMDLVGGGWPEMARHLHKPWIATMRDSAHRGKFTGSEEERVGDLMRAVKLGAYAIDVELDCPALGDMVKGLKSKARCLVSYHNWDGTPPLEQLSATVQRQLAAGADICKVVTMARNVYDNLAVLKLLGLFPWIDIISFAMGPVGTLSRVLSPMAGGYLTYASMDESGGSAPGQMSVEALRKIYRMIS
jgi:3-dehydroquinate dehydratase type I